MTTARQLAEEKYVLLTTFRKDGTPVPTPVWVVPEGDGAAAWTGGSSGKAKRLRRSSRATLTACTVRGKPLGPAIDVDVEIRAGEFAEDVRRRVAKKYSLLGHLITGFEKRGKEERVALVIRDA